MPSSIWISPKMYETKLAVLVSMIKKKTEGKYIISYKH
jgi:hypothetical protein